MDVGASNATNAVVQVEIAATSAAGSAADGVLGCTVAGQITLLTGWNWFTGSDPSTIGADQYDFETIVMHELGHTIGLGHSGDTGSVMYPYLASGQARRTVTAADLSVLEQTSTAPEPLLAAPWREATAVAPLTPAASHLAATNGVGPAAVSAVAAGISSGIGTNDLARNLFFALVGAEPEGLPLASRQLLGRSGEPGRTGSVAGDAVFASEMGEWSVNQVFALTGAKSGDPIFAGQPRRADDDPLFEVPWFPEPSQDGLAEGITPDGFAAAADGIGGYVAADPNLLVD